MTRRPKPSSLPVFDPEAPAWAQVETAIGAEAATRLSLRFGGRRLYVPRSVGAHHPLAQCLGAVAASQLCEFMAGQYFEPPLLQGKRARIVELGAANVQRAEIAERLHCTERFVYKVLKEQQDAAAKREQPSFFD
ncbi:MAG: hypothetical protein JWP35_3519 [Caulobacter sp.]|nr:hypothetical protein [Caulobacter sp.]